MSDADEHMLALANQQLSSKASAQPGAYLPALSAMRRILSKPDKIKPGDISLVERAIQKTLIPADKLPVAAQNPADLGLSQQYYKNLNRLNR